MELKMIECPRDAMQGMTHFVPTSMKIEYLNQLLSLGFDTLDCGSFVSPKAIPQMRDTAEVLNSLDLSNTQTKLLVIAANYRGALEASQFEQVHAIGFPMSISPTFQLRNTNSSIDEAYHTVDQIQQLCVKTNKTLVVYLSMGFGNPYGDVWNTELTAEWALKMSRLGVSTISLSDTVGSAQLTAISSLFQLLIKELPQIEFGAHLHTNPAFFQEKLASAYSAGCRRFDGAIKGFGGCPMASDQLTGNMPTELMLNWMEQNQINHGIEMNKMKETLLMADRVFNAVH
jgi:hydroxymethylglutaryl-CoA lyase